MNCIWGLLKGQRHCEFCIVQICDERDTHEKTITTTPTYYDAKKSKKTPRNNK